MALESTATSFLDRLRASGLLEPAQVNELSQRPEARTPTSAALARVVVQRGWLTHFQVNAIAAGRFADLIVGPYLLLDKLGEGGMGIVYKARHRHMNRAVALKVIRKEKLASQESVRRFYQEVQVAAQLSHPNIVLAYDAGQVGSHHYFAMEYVEGVDLAQLVKEKGNLPVAQACDYVRQAALGLQHAHEKGLVHRDIKPANLILASDGARAPGASSVVKLLDLGLARFQGDGQTGMTRIGAVLGTPAYLAPEQAVSSRAADIRSDLYSLGCTLYYLLTGTPPFTGTELMAILFKHQMEKPVPLAQRGITAPAGLQTLLDKLLAKRPEDRYQTPAELIAGLAPFSAQAGAAVELVSSELTKPAPSASPWQTLAEDPSASASETAGRRRRTTSTARRRPYLLLVAGGVAGGLILVLLLVWLLGPTGQSSPSAQPSQRRGPDPGTTRSPGPAPDVPDFPYFPGTVPTDAPLGRLDPKRVLPQDRPAGLRGVVAVLKIHTRTVWSLVFSPDGNLLASASEDSTVRLWDLGGKEPVLRATLAEGLGGGISSLAFSPDGRYLAFGSQQNVLQIWDLSGAQPKLYADLRGLSLSAQAAVFSPDSRTLASTQGGAVRLWDLRGDKPTERRLDGHTSQVNAVAFSPDGKSLATGGGDGLVRLWDLSPAKPKRITELAIKPADIWMAAFSPDGRSLVVTTRNGAGGIWEVNGTVLKERAKLPNDNSVWVHLGGFDAAGQTFVTYGGPRLRRWELASGRLREDWALPLGGGTWCYSPDRRHAAVAGPVQGTIYILRLTTPGPNS
jgi:serine/threonine protein kinase